MKQIKKKSFFINLALLIVLIFGLNSCYSDYLTIDYDTHHGAVWNNNGRDIAFVASKIAYRKAKGITGFPDGGIPKYLMADMGLYVLNTRSLKLTEIVNFKDLVRWGRSSGSNWKVRIAFIDSNIYYSIAPVTNWDWYISRARTDIIAQNIKSLRQKYDSPFLYNLSKKTSSKIDSTTFMEIYSENFKLNKIDLTELNKILIKIPLADWGLVVQDIYPKSDKAYIKETIYGYNKFKETKRAVIEQIIAKKSKPEIEAILKKMDKHRDHLQGFEKNKYEMYSKETYERIKDLL